MSNKNVSKRTLDKYIMIVDEWFTNGFNQTKAVQTIFPNKSDAAARKYWQRMSQNVTIENYIAEKKRKAQEALRTKHDGILNEITNWAYSDITQFIGLTPEQINQLPPEAKRLISKFKYNKRSVLGKKGGVSEIIETTDVWIVSKEKSMDMLSRHTGFYEKDNTQKIQPTVTREEREKYIEKTNLLVIKYLRGVLRKWPQAQREKKYTAEEFFSLIETKFDQKL